MPRNLTASVLRHEDLLALRFEFVNLKFSPGDRNKLARIDEPEDAFIIAHFAPQNIAEQAFFESAGAAFPVKTPNDKPGQPLDPDSPNPAKGKNEETGDEKPSFESVPVKSRLADPSRLVFKVPKEVASIEFTLESLLKKCGEYDLNVMPYALPPPAIKRRPAKFPGGVSSSTPNTANLSPAQRVMLESRRKLWQARSGLARYEPKPDDAEVSSEISSLFNQTLALLENLKLREPSDIETSIEAPYRLIVSPNNCGAWAHALEPVASPTTGRVELWHTRLGTRRPRIRTIDEDDNALRTIRAVWARSGVKPNEQFSIDPWAGPDHDNEALFRMSLDAFDRHNIVHLSSNFLIEAKDIQTDKDQAEKNYEPRPIDVDSLMLSALGAWMNTRGAWDTPSLKPERGGSKKNLSVEEWRQRGTMGRDHYVRVVYQGCFCPFPFRCSLIKVTERKFHPDDPGNTAYLRQRMYIVVREPEIFIGNSGLRYSGKDSNKYQNNDPNQKGQSFDMQMPFKSIRITTLVTPNLDDPQKSEILPGKKQSAFWPRVGNADFQFHLIAEDLEGQKSEFTMPLVFVGKEITADYTLMTTIAENYELDVGRRERPMHGQSVAFAESQKPGDISFEVDDITFSVEVPGKEDYKKLPPDKPRFYPVVTSADVYIPAIKHLAGNNTSSAIQFHKNYLIEGFAGNKGEVFAELTGVGTPLNFDSQGDRSGGLVKPNMQIKGLSRLMGPVSGNLNNLAAGSFDPTDFFAKLSPKIFGCINLADVIQPAGVETSDLIPKFVTENLTAAMAFQQDLIRFDELLGQIGAMGNDLKADIGAITADLNLLIKNSSAATNLPAHLNNFQAHVAALTNSLPMSSIDSAVNRDLQKLCAEFAKDLGNVAAFTSRLVSALQLPDELNVKFEWKPKIKKWGFVAGAPLFIPKEDRLTIAVEMRAKSNFKPEPSIDVLCRLEDFILDLIAPESFIKIHFDKLEFFANSGKKADVNVEIKSIKFVGPLSFVETLKQLIPLKGFSDPPSLDVTEKGIAANYTMDLPNIPLGMFSLQNLSLGAGFTIPFIGDPLSVRFNFCERHSPFQLTVMMFGGGGFFALTLDPQGVQILEAAFEFGASLSVDFGVASGGVHVRAGLYFKMAGPKAELTGYFRIGGNVQVLGIVSMSIELYLELRFEPASGKCTGKAVLTIEIEIAFFSETVEIKCERKFAGSNGDPTFAQIMGPQPDVNPVAFPWREYCGAFA